MSYIQKLEKIKVLADAMYHAAFYITTDASHLKKAMYDYHQFIIQNFHKEEPVSEDFEETLAKEWKDYNDRGAATVDALEDNTQELSFAKGFYRGAKWGKNQAKVEIQAQSMALAHGCPEESITEDLGEYINELSKQFPEVPFTKLSGIAIRVAKWKEKETQSIIELAEDHAMFVGKEKMRDEMVEKACKYLDKLIEILNNYGHTLKKEHIIYGLKRAMQEK